MEVVEEGASVRFVVDVMLGSLARWLRRLGYDTDYANDRDDRELVRIARAEGRVLLTRDSALATRKGISTLLIESQALDEQLAQVVRAFPPPHEVQMPRCAECNAPLQAVSPDEVVEQVPSYIYCTRKHFRRCPGCGRVYWPGSHWERIHQRLKLIRSRGCDADSP
ncbi:MAG: Mut7-C RNAse domain-containing protein [Anaerolineae bacterium]|nr:Mut7-C RNAse domain-containing protein [Anaerolineae bacterium]MDW8070075.1 Mut7-C RNAse domain-containing protein [Anaerolineae bacterium]